MSKKVEALKDSDEIMLKNKQSGRDAQAAPSKKVGKRPRFILNLVAMVGVLILLGILTITGLNIYTRHGLEITIPNVKGMQADAAVKKLEKMGLTTTIDDSVYVKTIPANAIYEQSIQAGSKAKEGRIIHLVVNSGNAPELIMPDIADNSSLREASARLTSLGFKLGPVEYMKGEKDWIYEVKCRGHNIGAGSRVGPDDEIVLVVGDGTYYDDEVEYQEGLAEDSASTDAYDNYNSVE